MVKSALTTEVVDFGTAKSNPRTSKIIRITPHHMAGTLDATACAKMHRDSKTQASANYYISDDKIVCGVSEDRRAWTSSSSANDQTAITFEVANSTGNPTWQISEKSYKSLVRLCADICKRYGIKPHYDGTPNGTITIHSMFSATACPGPYMKSLIESGQFERDIQNAMGGFQNESVSSQKTGDAESEIWNVLKVAGFPDVAVAGIMGNLYAESGLHPNNLQNTFEKKLGMSDDVYTASVDSGAYSKESFVRDSAGYGLAQWTFWSRKQNMYNYIKEQHGGSIGDLRLQADFLVYELSVSYKGLVTSLKSATTVKQASDLVLTQFEKPANQSDAVKETRAKYAQNFYNKFASTKVATGTTATQTTFSVKVDIPNLNIRKGPGTNYGSNGVTGKGKFTIVATSSGTGSKSGWGKLKSGAGWISLDYAKKV